MNSPECGLNILRYGSPDIKHKLAKELERAKAEIEASVSPAEAASENEADCEAKKGESHE
jgi:hypothetical protein